MTCVNKIVFHKNKDEKINKIKKNQVINMNLKYEVIMDESGKTRCEEIWSLITLTSEWQSVYQSISQSDRIKESNNE